MKLTRLAYSVSLLIVGLGLAIASKANASLQFNGSNSKAVLDGSYLDATTHSNYTFEVWIKPYNLGGTLLGKTEYWKDWTLDTISDGGIRLRGTWPNYYWGDSQEAGAGSITTNVWQHVCCAVTNGQASFYVNGTLVGTEAVQNPIDFYGQYPDPSAPSLDAAMAIGYTDSGTTSDYNFYNGLIYGIKVWSRTLSASEVGAIFTLGVPPSTNGLYNAVMLDEVSGSTIEDSRSALTGRNLTALQSSDTPPMSQADLSFTNSTPIASYFIDLSHYNDFKTPVLSSQTNYCFRATGRGGVGPLDRGDAMADAAFYPSFHPLTAKWAAPDNTWVWVGHTPFRPTPDVFNPAHVYYFYFQGSNTFEELTFQDSPYSDNVGGFNVDLFAVSGGCIPHAATATATLDHGFVVTATITDGGCGYTNTPAVLIVGGGGTGATATAVVSNGVVVGITINDAGQGYISTPTILISSPLGLQVVLIKAVKPSFLNLSLTTNYQMQISSDLRTWTNTGRHSRQPTPAWFTRSILTWTTGVSSFSGCNPCLEHGEEQSSWVLVLDLRSTKARDCESCGYIPPSSVRGFSGGIDKPPGRTPGWPSSTTCSKLRPQMRGCCGW